MDREALWHILRRDYRYNTPPNRSFFDIYIPVVSTLAYYFRIIIVILKGSFFATIGKYDRKRWANSSVDVLNAVEISGGEWHISGIKGLAKNNGPVVYVANHMSMIDTFIFPCLILQFHNATFVLKEVLLKYPFFGRLLKAINPIAVSRKNPRQDLKTVLDKGTSLISQGCSIIIFPQSTRSEVFDASLFNSLGVKLAGRAGVPVVPVALKTDFYVKGKFVKGFGSISPGKPLYAKFGDPIPVDSNTQEVNRKVISFITDNLKEWGCPVK